MNKVYCNNCKYYKKYKGAGPLKSCAPNFHRNFSKCYEYYAMKEGAKWHNENNDCKNYTRKWWKFWIK